MTNDQRSVADMLLKKISEAASAGERGEAVKQYSVFQGAVANLLRSEDSREYWYNEFRKEIADKIAGK